jgi:hypothetical protein
MAMFGPPASVPKTTLVTVCAPPFLSMATLTVTYDFFAEPMVWFQETATGFAVDTVAGVAFDAASKTTWA